MVMSLRFFSACRLLSGRSAPNLNVIKSSVALLSNDVDRVVRNDFDNVL